jgi:Type IV secretion system pilin
MIRFFLFLFGTLLPFTAFAAIARGFNIHRDTDFDCTGFIGCEIDDDFVSYFVARVLSLLLPLPPNYDLGFIFYVALAVFLWGALQMVLSRGEEMKDSGKNAMIYALLGITLALLASGILSYICGYIYAVGGTSDGGFCLAIWGQ